jgi:hypothetical protein
MMKKSGFLGRFCFDFVKIDSFVLSLLSVDNQNYDLRAVGSTFLLLSKIKKEINTFC